MNTNDLLNYFSYVTTILGLFGTFFYGIKSTRLQTLIKQFAWNDVHHGADVLCKQVARDFQPDAVLTLSPPGRIISSLMMIRSLRVAGEFSAIAIGKNQNIPECVLQEYSVVKTTKFAIGIPNVIMSMDKHKILIVDSAVVTGDLLFQVKSFLNEHGILLDNVRTASLIVTEFAVQSGKSPDYSWRVVKDADYSLPWGNLSMPWY